MKRALPPLLLLAVLAGCGASSSTSAVVSTAAPSTAPATTTSTLPPTTVPATTTTLSVADRTTALGLRLREMLCTESVRLQDCSVDANTVGVIKITLKGAGVSTFKLQTIATAEKVWTSADVARMGTTRAIDGTQRSSDGRATWTYHPDSGLEIILEVK